MHNDDMGLEAFSTIDKHKDGTILTLLIIPVKKIVLIEQNKKNHFLNQNRIYIWWITTKLT